MIKDKTVLILGAGASKPYGMPLGRELRDDVTRGSSSALSSDIIIKRCGFDRLVYRRFKADLAQSGFQSVDAFLEEREKWGEIGKAAMAMSLLKAEALARKKVFPPNQPKDHWYEVLWQQLRAASWTTFKSNPWHVVTFNYDRTLEHYLVTVLCNNYGIQPETACKALPILHVHGSLGHYEESDFGRAVTPERVKQSAASISVVHETNPRSAAFVRAHRVIREAQRILFIGFAYHPQNMEKLQWRKLREMPPAKAVLGTHIGIKANQWEMICGSGKFSPAALRWGRGTISDFMRELF
ncbi:MAG: hypothetical protein HZA91_00965 [Verrucomicrobia bacterium]|nr:hypothetical protein [Verrucomicrobiota bacterium]